MSRTLSMLVLLAAVAVAGCVDVTDLGPPGEDRQVPPSMTPPQVQPREAIAGTLRGQGDQGNRTAFAVDARILDCEATDRRVTRTVDTDRYEDDPPLDELELGDDLVLHLVKHRDTGRWTLVQVQTNLTAYREGCADRHRDDVLVQRHRGRMSFPANETRTVRFHLLNEQDVPLTVRFGAASMHDREVLQPNVPRCRDEPHRRPDGSRADCAERSYRERQQASRLDCDVAFPGERARVPANGTVPVDLQVTCHRNVSQDEARDVLLLGNGTFTDELGFDHRVPGGRATVLANFQDLHEARADRTGS